MRRLRQAGWLVWIWMLAAPVVLAQQAGRIEGQVTEARSGDPLPGASVMLHGPAPQGTTTAAEGRYVLADVAPGTYRLEVRMVGYGRAEAEVVVAAGRTATLDVALTEATYDMEEVVVSATRMAMPLAAVSGAVTVLDGKELAQQEALGGSLGDALGKLVPGLGVSTGSPSIYGQSLRGRTISVMIDGVPQSTTRNTSRDLATIDPSMIERVEVVRGATAIYGDGATGGIINIITRRPAADGLRFTTDVSGGSALNSPTDGLQGRLRQTVSGRRGAVDFSAAATVGRTGNFYDAEGDLIPPDPYGQGGLAATTSYGLQAGVGYTRGAHRLQLSVNHYDAEQSTPYVTDPAVDAQPPGEAKARAMEGLHLDEKQGSNNTIASLDYHREGWLGGSLHAQLFYRDYLTRFNPFDGRPYAAYRNIIQSYLTSEKYGARLEFERVLHRPTDLNLLAGLDYTDEQTQQPVALIDSTAYDQSGGLVYEKVGERPWVPLMNPRKTGLFAQLAWAPSARFDLQGGVRYEPTRMHIDDFTTLIGNEVTGGKVAYDPVLFNVGGVLHTTRHTEVYAAFSQGFSLTDLGLLLRNAADGFEVGNRTLKAQKVNNYEAGARATWRRVRSSVAAFYNASDLGTTSAGLDKGVVRAPERVYGAEATLDVQPTAALSLGGTFTWTEGENDADEDGAYVALNSYRIQPVKVTGYVQHRTLPGWTTRLQVLFSGSRDRAYEERLNQDVVGFGERPVERYLVVDLVSTFAAGPGTFKVGLNNLLDSQYYPVVSQLMWNGRNSSRAAAPGATLTLGYTVSY